MRSNPTFFFNIENCPFSCYISYSSYNIVLHITLRNDFFSQLSWKYKYIISCFFFKLKELFINLNNMYFVFIGKAINSVYSYFVIAVHCEVESRSKLVLDSGSVVVFLLHFGLVHRVQLFG